MDQTAQLQEMLNALSGNVNNTSGAFQQLAQALSSASKASGQNATANTMASQAMQQFQNRQQAAATSINSLGSTATNLVKDFGSVTSSIYGADKAFTSVIPTLDAFTSVFTKTIENIGKLTSGVTVFGISLGQAPEAIAKIITQGIEYTKDLVKFALEASQKVADAYFDVAKNGALFGASLTEFSNYAKQTRVPMLSLQKIVVQNAESISKLGLGMQNGAFQVAGLGRHIMDTDERLVALYGSIENLSEGIADYLSLQAQLGVDIRKDYDNQQAGAKEYLLRMRELSAITGKRAQDLKREEEQRRTQLDYQLKAGRLNQVAQENLREAMGVSGKIFGPEAQKYLEEYFATGGQVYSKSALEYEAMNTDAVGAMRNMISGIDQGVDAFRQNYQQFLKANAPALEASARGLENLAEINRSANIETIRVMTSTSNKIIENLTLIKNGLDDVDLKKFREEIKKPIDVGDPTKGLVDAQRAMTENQLRIDSIVMQNMGKMGEVVAKLNDISILMIAGQEVGLQGLNKLIDLAKRGETEIGNLGNEINEQLRIAIQENLKNFGSKTKFDNRQGNQEVPMPAPATISTARVTEADAILDDIRSRLPPSNNKNMPKRAEGGIADTPSIAGEDGPEAVIPLKGGKIPLQIDFDPVIRALETNNNLIERLNRNVEDSKDIQKQILNASY